MNLKFKKNNNSANPGKPPKICHNTYAWCISYTVRILIPFFLQNYEKQLFDCRGEHPISVATGRSFRQMQYKNIHDITHKKCILYFFTESYLRAPIFNFNINKSSIYFEWTQPPTHSGLIKNYTVSIRHDNGTSITSKSVGKQTSYIFPYDFIPGYRYNVTIASNVQIQQPSEQFIESSELGIVLGKTQLRISITNFQNETRFV